MNSSNVNFSNLENLFKVWTTIWVVASASFTLTFWIFQSNRYDAISTGLKTQTELLQGGSNEYLN